MIIHEKIVLLILSCCCLLRAEKLPSFIHVCHRSDPNIKQCLIGSVEEIRPYLLKGVPEHNIPSLEPLVIKDFFAEEAAGMKLKIFDVNTWGASDFFVRDLEVSMETIPNKFVTSVDIPKLRIEASYVVDGKLLMVPVNGQGTMEMNITDVSARSELQGELYEKDGEEYIKYSDIKLKVRVENGTILLVNMNKDKVLMQILNDIVNKNFKMFMHEFMPMIEKKLSSVIMEVANAIVGPFTYKQLFPE